MEVPSTWPRFLDAVAATIILKRHMHWLVNVTNPVAQELQCLEFHGIGGTSISNDLEINFNSYHHAFVSQWTWVISKLGCRAWQVDKMLPATFAGMIRLDART